MAHVKIELSLDVKEIQKRWLAAEAWTDTNLLFLTEGLFGSIVIVGYALLVNWCLGLTGEPSFRFFGGAFALMVAGCIAMQIEHASKKASKKFLGGEKAWMRLCLQSFYRILRCWLFFLVAFAIIAVLVPSKTEGLWYACEDAPLVFLGFGAYLDSQSRRLRRAKQ